jgi:hypothetical protein
MINDDTTQGDGVVKESETSATEPVENTESGETPEEVSEVETAS